jgi:hypothetical protein
MGINANGEAIADSQKQHYRIFENTFHTCKGIPKKDAADEPDEILGKAYFFMLEEPAQSVMKPDTLLGLKIQSGENLRKLCIKAGLLQIWEYAVEAWKVTHNSNCYSYR